MGCVITYNGQRYSEEDFKDFLQKKGFESQDIKNALGYSVPTAPFVTDTNSWVKLGLKVAMQEAVAQGADKIAWTTGEQQNERNSLEEQVNRIYVENVQEADSVYFVDIHLTTGQTINLEVENRVVRAAESPSSNGGVAQSRFVGRKLEDIVGKDIAEKIFSVKKGEQETIKGEDLKVGGKGMKDFYGSPSEKSIGIVGKVAKKLFGQDVGTVGIEVSVSSVDLDAPPSISKSPDGKKIGVSSPFKGESKVFDADQKQEAVNYFNEQKKKYEAEISKKSTSTQHSVDITPTIREEVEAGLPLFKPELPDFPSTPSERNSIESKAKEDGTWLKAPNGNPTNLTPAQWVTVRTRAFKDWFGDWEAQGGIGEDVVVLSNGVKLIKREVDENKSLYYDIVDQSGSPMGYIEISERDEYYQIGNVEVYNTGTGLGTLMYSELAARSDKPLQSDPSQTEAAKNLWERLVANGVAEGYTEIVQVNTRKTNRAFSRDRYKTLPTPSASKVVDENGEPMVVYHGTKSDFDTFREKRRAGDFYGIYFTADPSYAENYGTSIMPVFLSIKNPEISDKSIGSILPKYLLDHFKRTGKDGIFWSRSGVNSATELIAFSPNQIKSATANSGAFSSESDNIMEKPGLPDSILELYKLDNKLLNAAFVSGANLGESTEQNIAKMEEAGTIKKDCN